MANSKYLIMAGIFLLFVSALHAGCASDAYAKSCASCSFDANGKIDSSCSSTNKAAGTACVSTSYPIAAGKYAAGQCAQIDACASELQSCQAQYTSGNDKADCQEGSVAVCYSAADHCVQQAATKCGEIEKQCPGSSAALVIPLLLAGFVSLRVTLRK